MHSHAQHTDNIFRHITITDGLVNNKVTCILQDKEGFMWIGTQAGLQRYDGTRFKNFLADIRDTAALQTDWVSSIFEDSRHRLWIGTDHGAPYILDRQTGKFYNYNLHAAAGNKINGTWNFAEDGKGNIWLIGHDGIYKLDAATNQFIKWDAVLGLPVTIKTGTVTIDKDDNIWLCTTEGLSFYNSSEQKLYSRLYNPEHSALFDIKEPISSLLLTNKYIWITTGARLVYQYETATKKLRAIHFDMLASKKLGPELQYEAVNTITSLQNGQVIIPLLGRGLAYYQPASDSFIIVNTDNSNPYGFHSSANLSTDCITQDHDNNIFIGNETGINICNASKQLFFTHGVATGKGDLFPKTTVNDFIELPDGNILVGYYNINGGIVKTDASFKFIQHYLLTENGSQNSTVNMLWLLYRDETGIVWAPNQKKTVLKLDPLTGKMWEDKNITAGNCINIIKEDTNKDKWLGHWSKGLGKITAGTNTQQLYSSFLYGDSCTPKRVHSILVDTGKIWVGTFQNGLQVFDKRTKKFTAAYLVNEKDKNSISSNTILDIVRYNKDTLLLATEMGVNIFDIKRNLFKAITTKDGLPNNLVLGILPDKNNDIWVVCSGGGFCKISMKNFIITSYGVNEGIVENVLSGRIFGLKNGQVLVAAENSFFSFNPATIKASAAPANVLITGFSVFENERAINSFLKNNKPVKLPYNENSLRIEFASLDFWDPGTIKYYYKLDGVDKNWIPADKSHSAVYNQLKDGNYLFNVKCANKDGVFCINSTQLKICILPPFWKTWWFLLLISICLTSLVYLFIKWREKNINAIAAEKLKIQQLNAEQYKTKLELEQIINYFSSSLIDKNTVDDVLWDVAKNLIGQLGFVDCMIYVWNEDKTKMIQKAGFGLKDSAEEFSEQHFDVLPGQGVVGYVMQTKEAVVIADTAADSRYRSDDLVRLSEITVPVIYNNELIGVLDSEHPEKNFFTQQHLQVLSTIATLVANKIISIEAEQSLQQTQIAMYSMNEQLSKAKLEALRSQMNPHFIFNSLNAIQECILTNKVEAAYEYLSKFSKLQRMVLNNSEKELVPLSSEIEMLQLYLSLESLRFSKSFSYHINMESISDADEIMIPSLITQPLVENAIWHGLRNKEGEKTLAITYEEKESSILISIDDNGIGREKAGIIKQQKIGSGQYASKGTMILQQRLHVLSQQFKVAIRLTTTDKKDEQGNATGTTVVLSFPSNLETPE